MCAGVVTASGSAASTTQRSRARRSTSAFVPECLQLCALIGQLGAEFRYLRLQVVNVLVENGSTQEAQAEEEEEALPIHWVDYNETHHYHHVEPKKCSWESAGIVHHEPQ